MTNRWKLWVGVSALGLATGALPATPVPSPLADQLGIRISGEAWADESGEGDDASADCATEDGEGEEGGSSECESSSGEDGEGEG